MKVGSALHNTVCTSTLIYYRNPINHFAFLVEELAFLKVTMSLMNLKNTFRNGPNYGLPLRRLDSIKQVYTLMYNKSTGFTI